MLDIVHILARFWGGVGLIFSLALLARPQILALLIDEFDHETPISVAMGMLTIIIGIASLSLYSAITFDWRVIITLFGWATLIKGIRILVFPNMLKGFAENQNLLNIIKIIIFIYGIGSAILLSKGIFQ